MKLLMLFVAVSLSGCFLTAERQQASGWMFSQAEDGAKNLGVITEATKALVTTLSKPEPTEADVAVINDSIAKIATSSSSIADNLNEIGQTASVMQEDFGAPEPSEKVQSKPEATIMRVKYRAKAKAFNAFKAVIAKKAGIPLPTRNPAKPWSVSEIMMAVAAAAAAIKSGKVGTDQFLKYRRAALDGHRALGEFKKDVQPERFAKVMSENNGMIVIHQEQKTAAIASKG